MSSISNYQTKKKKSLETLLREKAYEEVATSLKAEGIDITQVSDEDIETLVAEKSNDLNKKVSPIRFSANE